MSMDFHPIQQTLLLVGTNVGDIGLWEVGSREKLVLKNFKVMNLSACSMPLQAALVKDPGVFVNRVIWSPDGSLFGFAYSRHLVQIYPYHGGEDVRQNVEIEAHVGGVNYLAFSHPNKQLCVITCGDDKTIKGEKECSFYVKTGQCKFGVTYKFHHPQPTAIMQAPLQPQAPPQESVSSIPSALYQSMQPPVPRNWPVARPSTLSKCLYYHLA